MPVLTIRAVPNASRSEVVGKMDDGALKVKLKAPPEGGRANKELIACLAKHYGVAKRDIHLLSGETSRNKRVDVRAAID